MMELRALSLGELLDRTFSYYRQHFWLFTGIMALPQVLQVALFLAVGGFKPAPVTVAPPADPGEALKQLGPALAASFVFFVALMIVSLLIYAVALGATTQALSEVHLGRAASIRGAYRNLGGKIWCLLGTVLLFLLIFSLLGAALFVLVIVGVSLTALILRGGHKSQTVFIMIGALTLLLTVVGMALAMIFLLRYAIAVPALVLENLSPWQALKRSAFLTKGYRGQIFLIGILMSLITLVVDVLSQGPFLAARLLLGFRFGPIPLWLQVPYAITAGAGGALSGPFLMIALALAYYDARVRKEGFDLQVMMAALDQTFQGSTAARPVPPAES
jgi:hypothetical protein